MNSILQAVIDKSDFDGVYLFVGNKGTLLNEIDHFIKIIMCEKHTACGSCPACKKVSAGVHADVVYINKSKTRYSVEDFKGIITDAYQKAYEGGKKVYVITDSEDMDEIVQNKLLKFLEEPPENTVIILGASNIKSLLPTVLSRCTVIRLDDGDYSTAKEHIIKEYGMAGSDAAFISMTASGDVRLASELAAGDYKSLRNDIFNISIRLINSRTKAYSTYLNKLLEYSDRTDFVFLAFDKIFCDLINIKSGTDADSLCNKDLAVSMAENIKNSSVSKIVLIYSIINNTSDRYISCGNINKRLMFEKMLIDILDKVV